MSYFSVCLNVRTLFSNIASNLDYLCIIPGLLFALFIAPVHGQAVPNTDQQKELRAQQLMVQAMTQSFLGYHDKAIPLFEEALRETPSSATINSALAESHEQLGDYASAIFYANQALLLDESEIFFHRQLIHLHIQSNDNEQAETLLKNLLSNFPGDIVSLKDLVEIQLRNSKTREALITQETLITLEGAQRSNLEVKLHILKVLQEWGTYESTLLELKKMAPQNVTYLQELALFYVSQDRPQDAIKILSEAVEIAPSNPSLTSMLARLYEKSGDQEQAQKLFNSQGGTNISDPDAAYQRALHLASTQTDNLSSIDTAKQLLRQALDLSPNHPEANTLLGTLLYEEDQFQEASEFLKKAVDTNPRAQDTWFIAADAFYKSFNYQQAALMAEDALLLFPGQLPLLDLAAKANLRLKKESLALEHISDYLEFLDKSDTLNEQDSEILRAEALALAGLINGLLMRPSISDSMHTVALKVQPENGQVLSMIALSLAEQGKDLDEAFQLAKKAVEIDPQNSRYMEVLGRVYFRQQKFADAEQWYQKVIQSQNPSPVTYEYLGDVLLEAGKPSEAIASWTKSLELSPDNPSILEKLRAHSN